MCIPATRSANGRPAVSFGARRWCESFAPERPAGRVIAVILGREWEVFSIALRIGPGVGTLYGPIFHETSSAIRIAA
jgi:hypothetical protein